MFLCNYKITLFHCFYIKTNTWNSRVDCASRARRANKVGLVARRARDAQEVKSLVGISDAGISDAGISDAQQKREAAAARPILLRCFDSETDPFEAKVPHKKRASTAHVSQAKGGKKRDKKHTGRSNIIQAKTFFSLEFHARNFGQTTKGGTSREQTGNVAGALEGQNRRHLHHEDHAERDEVRDPEGYQPRLGGKICVCVLSIFCVCVLSIFCCLSALLPAPRQES